MKKPQSNKTTVKRFPGEKEHVGMKSENSIDPSMKDLGQELNKILDYKSIELPVGPCDMLKIHYKISEWIAQRRQDILIAWWAEYGFEPGRAMVVDNARDHTWYVRRATDEEMEQHKNTLIQNKNPIIDELVEKILDADNKGLTLHDAQEMVMLAKQLKQKTLGG